MSNKLKLLEIVTNKINPPYKKEITPIQKDIIPPEIIDKLNPKRANLRGVATKPIKSCNTGLEEIKDEALLKILPKEHLGTVRSIIKIDEKTIACGGSDEKVTLIDISDKQKPRFKSYYTSLEDGVCEVLNSEYIYYVATDKDGWHFGNDRVLYRYARLYNPKADKLIPYFELESRVELLEGGKILRIKR